MAVTIKDIAVQTGLALSTISKYLNGGNVLPENREKIKQAIHEMGFTSNSFTRGLVTGRLRLIGIVLGSMENDLLTEIASVLENTFRRHGYACIISGYNKDSLAQKSIVEFLLSRHVDGIIFLPMQTGIDDIAEYADRKIPILALLQKPEDVSCDYITVDDYRAVFSAVRYFIGAGRQRIGYLGGVRNDPIAEERLQGYLHALKKARIEIEEAWIFHGDSSMESGYESMRQLLGLSDRPDAVLIGDNRVTIGAIIAVMEQGIQVPGQLSIIGFDNVMLAQSLNPCLNVIIHPAEKVADLAARTMLERLSGVNTTQRQTFILPSTFFIGNSV